VYSKYLSKNNLLTKIIHFDMDVGDLGTTDTYHEEKILFRLQSFTKDNQILLYKCAVQMAIIGYGKKNYGFIRLDDKNTITLEKIFKDCNIRYNEKVNAKYNDDELSARRLLRLFRYQIQNFIQKTNRPSYLWLKYADKANKNYLDICFPGAEHLIESKEEAIFLMKTYGNLDKQQNTQFQQRLQRVFTARGLLDPTIIQF